MEAKPTHRSSAARWAPWLISFLGVFAVAAFVFLYPPAKELAWETSRIVFSLIFTPFLLEIFCVVVGLLIVIAINNHRRAKEMEDEWVYLHEIDPDVSLSETEMKDLPEPLLRRIEGGSFVSKPVPVGAEERLAQIEGFLEIGELEEASAAMLAAPEDEIQSPGYLRVRIGLATLRGDERAIQKLIETARGMGFGESEIESAKRRFAG